MQPPYHLGRVGVQTPLGALACLGFGVRDDISCLRDLSQACPCRPWVPTLSSRAAVYLSLATHVLVHRLPCLAETGGG